MLFKRFCLLFILGLSVLFSFAGEGYSIKVKITGLTDSSCLLVNYYGDKQYLKDTAMVDAKGKMEFRGSDELPLGVYSIVLPNRKYFDIIVDRQEFSLETDTGDLVGHMVIKGSPEN